MTKRLFCFFVIYFFLLGNSFAKENYKLQTGPAVRNDRELIEKHLNDLGNDENLKEIYELFTQQIIKRHHEL